MGHIAYYSALEKIVFTGDTLFSLGCGRCFEGTPPQLWRSLLRLRNLPPETKVYCGHEYTLSNLEFALSLTPTRQDLIDFKRWALSQREAGLPTIPSTIEREQALNPFLQADNADFVKHLELGNSDPVAVFTQLRRWKDEFNK